MVIRWILEEYYSPVYWLEILRMMGCLPREYSCFQFQQENHFRLCLVPLSFVWAPSRHWWNNSQEYLPFCLHLFSYYLVFLFPRWGLLCRLVWLMPFWVILNLKYFPILQVFSQFWLDFSSVYFPSSFSSFPIVFDIFVVLMIFGKLVLLTVYSEDVR